MNRQLINRIRDTGKDRELSPVEKLLLKQAKADVLILSLALSTLVLTGLITLLLVI